MMLPHPLMWDIGDSWTSLTRRPLRSILSSLGIGIGVAALIAMLSISEGGRQATLKKIESLGVNTLRIERNDPPEAGGQSLRNLSQGLSRRDQEMLRNWIGGRGRIGGYLRFENVTVYMALGSMQVTLLGVDSEWFEAEKLRLREGRPIVPDDVRSHARYCILGADVASTLQAQLLSTVRYGEEPLTVIGIAEKKGRLLTEGTALSALDFDRTLYLPDSTVERERPALGDAPLDGLVITLTDTKRTHLSEIAGQVEQILLKNHRGVKDFEIVVPYKLLEEARANQRTFSLIMGAIAGLSLVVGGIGVLNVMLANIAEQTRDIGLRVAIGATRGRIVRLYLCHSILLSLSGSIWGTGVGVGLALVIQRYAEWDVAFSGMSLFVAPCAAILTGVIFGLHPAFRAASLEPALALRDV